MAPKVDLIDWPVIDIMGQRLTVRWTFYVQFMLSKRKVSVTQLPRMMQEKDPGLVELMVECWTAAVAENYTQQGQVAPSSDFWAQAISQAGDEVWRQINTAIWEAVKKARPAANQPAQTQPAPAPLAN